MKLFALVVTIFLNVSICCAYDFSYSISDPSSSTADDYIVSKSNVEIIDEGTFVYWKQDVGAASLEESDPGTVIYKFDFQKPIAQGNFFTRITTFHWSYSKGHSFIYASKDGIDWIKLAEATPPPDNGGYNIQSYNAALPTEFIGSRQVWIKVELNSYGINASYGGAMTNTAQHLRYEKAKDNTTFKLEVDFGSGTNIDPDPTPCSITLDRDLTFTIPNAIYDAGPLIGKTALKLDFQFIGEQNDQLMWKLGNVGTPASSSSCSVSIDPDLSFTLANAIYDGGPQIGQLTLQAEFGYSGEQAGSLLWRLTDIKIINGPPVIPQDNIIQVGDASLEIVYAGLDSEAESRTLLARQMEMHGSALLQAVILTNSALMIDQTTIDAVEWNRRLDLAEQAWAIAEQVNTSLKNQSSQLELATNKVVSQNLQAADLELMVNNLQGSRGEIQRLAESQGVDIREMRRLIQEVVNQQQDQDLNSAQRYGMAADLINSFSNAASGLALAVGSVTLAAGSAPVTAVGGLGLFVVGGTTAILNTAEGIKTILQGEGQVSNENVGFVFSTLNEINSIFGVISGGVSDALFYLGGKVGGMINLDAIGHTTLTYNRDGTVSFIDVRSEEYEQYIANQSEPLPFTTGIYILDDGTRIDVNDDFAFRGVRNGLSYLASEQLLVTLTPADDTSTTNCPVIYDSSLERDTDRVANGYWVNNSKCQYEMSLKPFYLAGEYPYVNGELNGLVKMYKTSGPAAGKIKSKQEYADGVKVGYTSSYYYDESGQLTGCTLWSNGVSKGSCL